MSSDNDPFTTDGATTERAEPAGVLQVVYLTARTTSTIMVVNKHNRNLARTGFGCQHRQSLGLAGNDPRSDGYSEGEDMEGSDPGQ